MRALFILSCLFFIQTTYATVLHVNQNDSLVYFHPTPYLDLNLKEASGTATATLGVSFNYSSNMIQREFNSLIAMYNGYEIKISPAVNVATVFVLDLPTVGIRKEIKLRQTNMGPYFSERIPLSPIEVLRFKYSKANIEASVFSVTAKATYNASVEVERFEAVPEFCPSLNVVQVKDMIFVIGKIEKPAAIQNRQTFDSLKYSALGQCFELETTGINSFTQLMQSRVTPKPGAIAHGSHFEKKPQELIFEIQPSVDVLEAEAE